MGVLPAIFLAPMEPSVRRVVEQVRSVQPLRVDNEMQNAKFKMQTARTLPQPSGVRRAARAVVP
jgi:hypothetical protein